MSAETHCPLCAGENLHHYHRDQRRDYLQCARCALVFVTSDYHLGAAAERAEYDLHENAVDDPGYRKFLSRLHQPLVRRLPVGAVGLDFGCGPAPALALMLAESGFPTALYDPFYFPDQSALDTAYDFICATEVVEHLSKPGLELEQLWQKLLPGGYLAFMTKLVIDRDAFARWHYKNDPTHISFFSARTWDWWAAEHSAALEIVGADVIFLRRGQP